MSEPQKPGRVPSQEAEGAASSASRPVDSSIAPAEENETRTEELQREQVLRIRILGGGAALYVTKSATGLERTIARAVKLTREKDRERLDRAEPRSDYKCICPEGSRVEFVGPGGERLEAPPQAVRVVRVKPADQPGVFHVVELKDPAGNRIGLPAAGFPVRAGSCDGRHEASETLDDEIADWLSSEDGPAARTEPAPAVEPGGGPGVGDEPLARSGAVGGGSGQGDEPDGTSQAPPAAVQRRSPAPLPAHVRHRLSAAKASSSTASSSAGGAASKVKRTAFPVTPAIEQALRELLQEKAREQYDQLAGKDVEGKPWAAALLDVVNKAAAKPENQGKHLAAEMVASILDPLKMVNPQRRMDVYDFCEEIMKRAGRIGLSKSGKLKRLRAAVKPFAEHLLAAAGEKTGTENLGVVNKELTLADVLRRIDPAHNNPLAIQQRALEQMQAVIRRELLPSRRPRDEGARQKHTQQLNDAIKTARESRAFESLPVEQKRALGSAYSDLSTRINRGGSPTPRKPGK